MIFFISYEPGQPHDFNKPVEIDRTFSGFCQQLLRSQKAPSGYSGSIFNVSNSRLRIFIFQSLHYFMLFECGYFHMLGSGEYGRQVFVRIICYKEKNGEFGWLFENFQELIGTINIHQFGQPNNHHLILRLVSFQTQFPDNFAAFIGINHPLLGTFAYFFIPVVNAKIRIIDEHFPKIGDKIITYHGSFSGGFDNGENEM